MKRQMIEVDHMSIQKPTLIEGELIAHPPSPMTVAWRAFCHLLHAAHAMKGVFITISANISLIRG